MRLPHHAMLWVMAARLDQLAKWWRWRRSLGGRGERAAMRFMQRNGYRVLAKNLRNRFGEIDLVVEDRVSSQIVIVEVKTAANDSPPPESHVNFYKQRKLSALAGQLIQRYHLEDRPVRFDVVGIVWPSGAKKPTRITHHKNAFQAAV